jgi:DNA-binding beta-propeller fold protein YncE
VDAARNVFIADSANHRVRVVLAAGWVRAFAGTGEPGASEDGMSSLLAPLRNPAAVAVDASGNLYIADTANHRIVRVGADGKTVSVITKLNGPRGLTLDRAGNLYVADTGNHSILKVSADGKMVRVAGTGVAGATGDGGVYADRTKKNLLNLFQLKFLQSTLKQKAKVKQQILKKIKAKKKGKKSSCLTLFNLLSVLQILALNIPTPVIMRVAG